MLGHYVTSDRVPENSALFSTTRKLLITCGLLQEINVVVVRSIKVIQIISEISFGRHVRFIRLVY